LLFFKTEKTSKIQKALDEKLKEENRLKRLIELTKPTQILSFGKQPSATTTTPEQPQEQQPQQPSETTPSSPIQKTPETTPTTSLAATPPKTGDKSEFKAPGAMAPPPPKVSGGATFLVPQPKPKAKVAKAPAVP